KKLLTLILILACFVAEAQFNHTYDINGNNDYLFPGFDIVTRGQGTTTVSFGMDASSWPRTDYLLLTKLDAQGGLTFNNRFDPFAPLTDGISEAKALIQTPDSGIL